MASDGSGLSSDPSSTATAHFGQRAPDNARAGAGSGGPAAAPAVPEPGVADEVHDIGSAGPDTSEVVELTAVALAYAPLRTRSASSTRASPASQRSASQRGRGVGDVDTSPPHHVRVGTTPGGSPASRTTAGGAGPVSPHHRLPDPSQASLTRDGGGGPLLDPYGADPNTYRDGVQSKSPNPPTGDTPVTTGSSGSSLGPSASARDELSEAAVATTGTTSTPPMLPTPSGPPMTPKPIQATDTSTSSLSSWVQVPAAGGLAGGGDAPRNAEQRMEWELEKMKREANENVPAEPVAKRTKSPAMRNIGSVPLGVGVPLNPSAPPLPPPPPRETQSYHEAIQHFDSGPSMTKAPPQVPLALSTSQSSASKTSYEELYQALETANKAKDEQIGVLKESKKDLETMAAASANAAAAASSHAAAVVASAQQQAQAAAAASSHAAAAEASARQQTQQVLTGAARTESELAAGELRVEELEKRLLTQTQLGTHMATRYAGLKAEYETVLQQVEMAKMEIFRLSHNPPTCPECPRKQELIDRNAIQLQANSVEITGLRGRVEVLASAAHSWEEKYNREVAMNAQLSQEVTETRVNVTRLTHRGDELTESLRISQASLADASTKTTALQARVGEAEALAARASAEVAVYASLPSDVTTLQTRCMEQHHKAQTVVDNLIESKRAIAVQLSEVQSYAQGIQNSVMQKDDAINMMSDKNASLAAEITAAKQKATEDAQRVAELTSDRDAYRQKCIVAAAGPPTDLLHPDVREVVKARCAEVLRATADRYAGQLVEAEREWQGRIQDKENTIEELQNIVNNNLAAMAGGADNLADNNGPSVEEIHEADWSDPTLLDGLAAELGLDLPPIVNLPPAASSSGNRAGGGQGPQPPR